VSHAGYSNLGWSACSEWPCCVVTFGQYMRPTKKHIAVVEYITPEAGAFTRPLLRAA